MLILRKNREKSEKVGKSGLTRKIRAVIPPYEMKDAQQRYLAAVGKKGFNFSVLLAVCSHEPIMGAVSLFRVVGTKRRSSMTETEWADASGIIQR